MLLEPTLLYVDSDVFFADRFDLPALVREGTMSANLSTDARLIRKVFGY